MKTVYKRATFLLSFFAGVIAFTPREKQPIVQTLPNSLSEDKKILNAALLQAARKGDLEEVRTLLAQGADIHAVSKNGRSCIHLASKYGHRSLLKLLYSKDIDFELGDKNGSCALHFAAQAGHAEIVEDLINSYGVDPNSKGWKNMTALHYAALDGHLHVVKSLFTLGASLEERNCDSATALAYAWINDHEDIVAFLTGLSLTRDEEGNLMAQENAIHEKQLPHWKKLMCLNYRAPISDRVDVILQKIAQLFGLSNIIFFQTANKCPHASDVAFAQVGLPKHIVKLLEKNYDQLSGMNQLNYETLFCIKELYHELTHLKHKHDTKRIKAKASACSPLALMQEMEAELAAMYYLYINHKNGFFSNTYIEDEMHPTKNEHHRYIAHLYARLLDNNATEYSVVTELAERYRQEKAGEQPPLDDIIELINERMRREMCTF